MLTLILVISLLLNGILILTLWSDERKQKPESFGKVLLVKDEVDKEVYFAIEVSCSQLLAIPDGTYITMQVEHRNSNTGFNEGK